MKRVTGIGGIFFKSQDPKSLRQWYEKHLGIVHRPEEGGTSFKWRELDDPGTEGQTVWSVFPHDTKYLKDSKANFMINYRVDDMDALLDALRTEGVEIDPHRDDADYGRFAWITDPDGNRIELWEPPKKK